jgi:hypothetical protein
MRRTFIASKLPIEAQRMSASCSDTRTPCWSESCSRKVRNTIENYRAGVLTYFLRYRCSVRTARKDRQPLLRSNSYAPGHGPASNYPTSNHESPSSSTTFELEYRTQAGTCRGSRQSVTTIAANAFISPLFANVNFSRICASKRVDTPSSRSPNSASAACSPAAEAANEPRAWCFSRSARGWTRTCHEGSAR